MLFDGTEVTDQHIESRTTAYQNGLLQHQYQLHSLLGQAACRLAKKEDTYTSQVDTIITSTDGSSEGKKINGLYFCSGAG